MNCEQHVFPAGASFSVNKLDKNKSSLKNYLFAIQHTITRQIVTGVTRSRKSNNIQYNSQKNRKKIQAIVHKKTKKTEIHDTH
jgi:hypothetical protein